MSLHEPPFRPVPLASIRPRGWLAEQLRIQANGLSGHLDRFWPDIADSAWIGGAAEGWERMPYWLDGVVPLAWLLRDQPLQRRIEGYLDYIIEHQHDDGWLGPRVAERANAADLWSQALALKMLVGYHDATGDARVPGCVERALRCLDRHVDRHPLSLWGQYRWFEFLIAIWWLHERTGERWLIDLAVRLRAQGFDWCGYFRQWPRTVPDEQGRWSFDGHVVNNAMALKEGALWWRLTGEDADREAARTMMDALDRHHGMATGVFTGDECLAGTDPSHGTELCAVAEYLYSLEWLIGVHGASALADRLERIAFNALPATFSPDMWAHQYDQQVNQIECSVRNDRQWTTNGPDANVFGLEPNFGCCTANLSQAWPKFAAHLWMRSADGGIVAAAYAPSMLETQVDGVPVRVDLRTGYPFRQELRLTVRAERPVRFPLLLRIPGWADGATIEVGGRSAPVPRTEAFQAIERAWSGETPVVLSLPMAPRIVPRPRGAVCVARGPLLYALRIGERWQRINRDLPHREPPHADWEVHPTTAWNYALELGDGEVGDAVRFTEHRIGSPVFSPDAPPVTAAVSGRRVAGWAAEGGSAGPMPESPVAAGGAEELTLIPYGCSNLRIAEFPVVGDPARKE